VARAAPIELAMRRLVLGLNAATVLLVIGGIALLVFPSPMPAGRSAASLVASTGALPDSVRQAPAPDFGAAERVVRTDIFSARRSAPAKRYVFGDTAQDADVTPTEMASTPLAGEPVDSAAVSTATDAVPHLYGTMLGAGGASALLKLDASVSEPRLYRVGDRAGGYRVVEIGDRQVTLSGSGGRVVLRLRSAP
jgi:hypothetical protein